MTKVIDNTNLGYLISKIKAAFWGKNETTQVSIDNAPTANSNNLVKSGGVYSAIDSKYTKPSTGIPASDLASGTIPEPETFIATYSVTSYADVKAAYDAGKLVFAKWDDDWYVLSFYSLGSFSFIHIKGSGTFKSIVCASTSGGIWMIGGTKTLQYTSNLVTALSSSSTDTEYPSAKATYDEIHPAIESSQPANGFAPNVLYNLGTLSGNTTFSIATPSDANVVNHYYWTFDTGSTAPTITWPSGLTWYGGSAPAISTNKHYEISIVNNVAISMEV